MHIWRDCTALHWRCVAYYGVTFSNENKGEFNPRFQLWVYDFLFAWKKETDSRKCMNTVRLIINKIDRFWQIGIKSMHERISYTRHQLTNRKIRPFALPTKLLKWWKISIIQLTNVSIGNDVGLVAFQTIARSERNVHCTSFSTECKKWIPCAFAKHRRLACARLYAPTNLFVRDYVLIKSKCLLVFTNGAIFACNNQNVNRHENPHEHEHDSQMLSITWRKLLNDLVSLAKATLSSIDRANGKKGEKKIS